LPLVAASHKALRARNASHRPSADTVGLDTEHRPELARLEIRNCRPRPPRRHRHTRSKRYDDVRTTQLVSNHQPVGGVEKVFARRSPGRRRHGKYVLATRDGIVANRQVAVRTGQPQIGQLTGGGARLAVDGAAGLRGGDRPRLSAGQVEFHDRGRVDGEDDFLAV
jgi:hypothetical protein